MDQYDDRRKARPVSHTRAFVAAYIVLSAATGVFQALLRLQAGDLRVATVASLFPLVSRLAQE